MTFQFASIGEFFAMGGYGFYVWLAYAVTFVAMGALLWLSHREHKSILRNVKKESDRAKRLKQ